MNISFKHIQILMTIFSMVVLCACMITPTLAFADPTSEELQQQQDELVEKLSSLQVEIERLGNIYNKTTDEIKVIENQIEEHKDQLQKDSNKIDELQDRMATRCEQLYKQSLLEQILEVFVGNYSLADVISNIQAINDLNTADKNAAINLKNMKAEVEAVKQELSVLNAELIIKQEETTTLESEAKEKEIEYNQKIEGLEEDIKQAIIEEAQLLAIESNSTESYIEYSTNYASIPANGSVVDYAMSRLGCPYVWAAAGPNSFDCSGLTMWCYAQVGISLPHYTESQYACAKAVLPLSQAQPGDILYTYGHVGIYIGNGQYIHAPTTGDVVRIASWTQFSCALRF